MIDRNETMFTSNAQETNKETTWVDSGILRVISELVVESIVRSDWDSKFRRWIEHRDAIQMHRAHLARGKIPTSHLTMATEEGRREKKRRIPWNARRKENLVWKKRSEKRRNIRVPSYSRLFFFNLPSTSWLQGNFSRIYTKRTAPLNPRWPAGVQQDCVDWLRGKDFVEFELETKCRDGFPRW